MTLYALRPMFSYLRLVRLPYLFTAAAEVITGYLLGQVLIDPDFSLFALNPELRSEHLTDIILLSLLSMALYAAGMVFNDINDRERDAKIHPRRPLVKREIKPDSAFWLAVVLSLTALFISETISVATTLCTTLIIILIILYDFGAKNYAVLSGVNMGILRALNFLLGITAQWANRQVQTPLILVPFIYIFFITLLSAFEEKSLSKLPRLCFICFISLALFFPLILVPYPLKGGWVSLILLLYFIPKFVRFYLSGRGGKLVSAGVLALIPLEASLLVGFNLVAEGLIIIGFIIPVWIFLPFASD